MKKNKKNHGISSFWCSFFLCLLLGIIWLYGKAEKEWNHILMEKIAKEQRQTLKEETQEKFKQEDSKENEKKRIRVLLMDEKESSPFHKNVVVEGENDVKVSSCEFPERVIEQLSPHTKISIRELITSYGDVVLECEKEGSFTLSMEGAKKEEIGYEGKLFCYGEKKEIYVVNELPLETYLNYVVPSEMPSSYPLEALKAQAICARTYACYQMQQISLQRYHADVDDTVSYQVYHNIEPQTASKRAVEETGGLIMTFDGEPIPSYFFSTSWGFTGTDLVWEAKEPAPYLKSVPISKNYLEKEEVPTFSEIEMKDFFQRSHEQDYEKEEPWYRWETEISLDKLAKQCESSLGEVRSLSVEERFPGGGVKSLLVRGTSGEKRIENEYRIRQFLGSAMSLVKKQDGTETAEMMLLPSASFVLEPLWKENRIIGYHVYGGGYGHGVGMSQNGAKQLAKEGKTYEEILRCFYQKITLAQD